MPENESELRRIAWSQAFPFVRLFRTLRLALNFNRLLLAFVCVILLYGGGRLLDAIWGSRGGVTRVELERPRSAEGVPLAHIGAMVSEIEVYAQYPHPLYRTWLEDAKREREQQALRTLRLKYPGESEEQLERRLEEESLRALMIDKDFKEELKRLRSVIDTHEEEGLRAIKADEELSKPERRQQRDELKHAADLLRTQLSLDTADGTAPYHTFTGAVRTVVNAGPEPAAETQGEEQVSRRDLANQFQAAIERVTEVKRALMMRPKGPFISLLLYETRCFAAAIQGVCKGRWGMSGAAFDEHPAMIGSIVTAVQGGAWLLNQRPWYALVYGVFALLVLAYFGGAICRSAAVQSARDESVSIGESLQFVRDRYGGFVLAPLLPVFLAIGVAVLLFVGGLVGAIPFVEILSGLFYPLALLGGFAAAISLLALLFGFHLMWPTIAVEGSDGFDALSRSCAYLVSRIWHVLFYAFVLLLYGALSFVILRIVLVVTLKLTNKFTGWGMNVVSSADTSSVGKMEALWTMPAWSELSLLPSRDDTHIWGRFGSVPLAGHEWLASGLIMIWVFLLVGLLGAFVISYFFCGSTQMYFLLRRDVDATDYEDVYYEEAEEEFPPAPPAPEAPPAQPDEEPPQPPAEGEQQGEGDDEQPTS